MNEKQRIFRFYRRSLAAAEISTTDDHAVICPLCWQDVSYKELSLEHTIPKSVGGKQTILTCKRCNNDDGSKLDSQMARYMSIVDAFQGHGDLPTVLTINGHSIKANLQRGDGTMDLRVVGNTYPPEVSAKLHEDFVAGNVKTIDISWDFKSSKNGFQTAVLRSAYLIAFKCLGYEYAKHGIVQAIRQRIKNLSLDSPRVASLVLECGRFASKYDKQHYVVPGNVNGVEFFLVIIRLRKKTTKYFGAFLPVPIGKCESFFTLMEAVSNEHNGESFRIPEHIVFG